MEGALGWPLSCGGHKPRRKSVYMWVSHVLFRHVYVQQHAGLEGSDSYGDIHVAKNSQSRVPCVGDPLATLLTAPCVYGCWLTIP